MRKREQGVGRNIYADFDAATKTSSIDNIKERDEFLEEFVKFVKHFLPRNFKAFESDPNDDPRGYVDLVVKAIEKGDPTIVENEIVDGALYYLDEQMDGAYRECLKEFCKQFEDPDDILYEEIANDPEFDSIFNEIYEERQNINPLDVIHGLNLLVWNNGKEFHLGWSGDPQDLDSELVVNPDLEGFFGLAEIIAGLTKNQEEDLVNNGFDYNITAFIGGIIDAEDLLRNMLNGETGGSNDFVQVDETVVAFWDGWNGAGYFVRTEKRINLTLNKNDSLRVDFGNYSLGDVFGTNEWTWKVR